MLTMPKSIPHRSTGKQPLKGNIQHRFVQEGPRVSAAIYKFTNSGCFTSQFWWGDVRQHWRHCNCVDFTVPDINRNVLFSYWCANYSTTLEHSIEQSNRQVPMKQFVMRLPPYPFVPISFRANLRRAATFFAVFDK
jgi:hypothetical protein